MNTRTEDRVKDCKFDTISFSTVRYRSIKYIDNDIDYIIFLGCNIAQIIVYLNKSGLLIDS